MSIPGEVLFKNLLDQVGEYKGQGVNHEGESFTGHLVLNSLVGEKGIEVNYLATGEKNEVFHQERTIVAFEIFGHLKMWNLNSNSPGMMALDARSGSIDRAENGIQQIVFGFGDLDNRNEFREEIKIEWQGSMLGYHYSWGMPGEEFDYRSGLRMIRKE